MTTKQLEVKINQSIISVLGRKLYTSRFADVILRELIQNALDASATSIRIYYANTGDGKYYLNVQDNGTGIAKIEGLMDTIGESIKSDNVDNIGGYGLAKLAIFGCKNWEFISTSGSFRTGFIYDSDNRIGSGTIVRCELETDDVFYDMENYIESYCITIARECEFYVNDVLVHTPDYKVIQFGMIQELACNTNNNGQIVVRVNGLPTFKEYVNNLKTTIILDYHVDAKPYDNDYPLSSNRDGFLRNSKEYADYKARKQAIETQLETDKLNAENITKSKTSRMWRGKKYVVLGDVSESDFNDNANVLSTYKRYILQIHALYGCDSIEETVTFGLTDGQDDELACYNTEYKAFCISVGNKCKGEILASALHEYVHYLGYGLNGHDQRYASKLTTITGVITDAIFNGQFRK